MPASAPQSRESAPRRGISRRAWRFILSSFIAVLLLIACGAIYMRPTARVNRLLKSVGLSSMPANARNLRVHRRQRFLATRATYMRFEAPADEIAQFVRGSSIPTRDDSAPMASLSFGPRCPEWMVWEATVEGRIYHWTLERNSVWLAADDEAQVVYVGVFESRIPWLRRILN